MVGNGGGGGGGVSEPALNISVFYCFPSTSLREPFYCKSERRNRRVSARPFVAFSGEPPPPEVWMMRRRRWGELPVFLTSVR